MKNLKFILLFQDLRDEIEKDYESYFKCIVYENLTEYYERKQERIDSTKQSKRLRSTNAAESIESS
jgi:hypothetical protein